METTRRKLASMSCCLASRPTCSMRPRRRFSRRSSSTPSASARSSSSVAATPASIFMARSISSAAVSRGTLPISLRYMRTGSPVSMVTPASALRLARLRARALVRGVTFGRAAASTVAFSSSSGMPSSRSSSESMPASILSSVRLSEVASFAAFAGGSALSMSSSSRSSISSTSSATTTSSVSFSGFFFAASATR